MDRDESSGRVVVPGGGRDGGFYIVEVDSDVIPIWVVEFWVLTRVELNREQRGDEGDGGVGEEAEVLAGEGVGRRGGVGKDEAEAESRARGNLR